MTSPIEMWQGEFGRAYTDRNVGDVARLAQTFRRLVGDLPVRRVLEVGCNRGHNLVALREVLGPGAELVGAEPNAYARQIAGQTGAARVVEGHLGALPFPDGDFDLAFTAGVLIHVALADLPRALAELHRCSRRYLLAVEYYAEKETVVPYHGHDGLLWKRDFLQHYREQFPDLALVRAGDVGPDDGMDHCKWWLLEKRGGA